MDTEEIILELIGISEWVDRFVKEAVEKEKENDKKSVDARF